MQNPNDGSPFSIVNAVLDLCLVVLSSIELFFCCVVAILVVVYHKQTFNALWAARLLLVSFVVVWDIAIISGIEYLWYNVPAAASVTTLSILCRVNIVGIFGLAQPAVTCTLLFILVHQFPADVIEDDINAPTQKMIPNSPQSPIVTERFTFPRLYSNLTVIWKSGLVILIILVIHITILIIDIVVIPNVSTYIPFYLFTMFQSNKLICTTPVITVAIYVIYYILFTLAYNIALSRIHKVAVNQKLKRRIVQFQIAITAIITLGIISRVLEVISVVLDWTGVDRLIREISLFTDIIQSLLITIAYVLIPLVDAILTARWLEEMEKKANIIQNMYLQTLKYQDSRQKSEARLNPLTPTDLADVELQDVPIKQEHQPLQRQLSVNDVTLDFY